ncbi:EamA family transporter [Pacificitalea manganoxidans]|uniref:EamA family transporter n=1 Tax=Pacificitalea manganoxidans TaxID=1411902 RepID=A0A291LVS5_9RHOB|nr:DMT family transporter [Pacificitalea manganoxidans]ATI40800.1 EamA family transporter [Pacificitalea manganoxidans]MBF53875.1 EamA/RhaT family transporter [Actibacterium sp.]MDR6309808.1 drug/metabolite transporter (DMT)-like permease [Pacificitalea manganoxidans]OWU69594.1 RhaT family transporter [Roseovarius sp. 22II1-1F6A]
MTEQNTRLGIILMVATTFVFASQDAISRHLATEYNVYMIVMIRYWAFAMFVTALAARSRGGLARVLRPRRPVLQVVRGVILAIEVVIMVFAFVYLGLVESHAIFAAVPLIITALSGPVLGEKVGWRRWSAIGIGFIGILVILQPGGSVFAPAAILPLLAAAIFAAYGLLTRLVARDDGAQTSFFWTGVAGAATMTLIGVFFWEPMIWQDWLWMGVLCCTSTTGHYLLIKCYDVAEASAVQPLAYCQLVFGAFYGVAIYGEPLESNVILGAGIVVAAGLFTFWRTRQKAAV